LKRVVCSITFSSVLSLPDIIVVVLIVFALAQQQTEQ